MRLSQFGLYAGRLMYMATKEIVRLMLLNELSDCRAPRVDAIAYAVQRSVLRRTMANQNQPA